ncbi:MAG: hypothetical protein G01um101448_1077 [Parcubacteria group bacterium Gr01-1014_48]|nr:MAG: hypothetical protein G01um101448_1077 [Parcubacteria group bacterium Gr01-1014_48]TSC99250.1 MAG: hypothetical protein Greene101415_1173 [Parcubacteria group bacterium Greene1014_15]TSD07135.1 MAG: hypothetical protein Greene07144_1010 [Parcubacteria group bacterium Greene0714_4]
MCSDERRCVKAQRRLFVSIDKNRIMLYGDCRIIDSTLKEGKIPWVL